MESSSGVEESAPPKAKVSEVSDDFPHWHITPTPVGPSLSVSTSLSLSSTNVAVFPVVVVPKLAIPAKTYPEQINRPGGHKDYLCLYLLCPFRHSNLDSILTHVRKHLEIIIGCAICSKGYPNDESLHKHGRDIHSVQIVASNTSLSDVIPKEQI